MKSTLTTLTLSSTPNEYGEQGFRVLATKTIVEEVTSPDHQISLAEVQEVAPEAQAGDTVVLDVTPEQRDFGRMAAIQNQAGAGPKTAGSAA